MVLSLLRCPTRYSNLLPLARTPVYTFCIHFSSPLQTIEAVRRGSLALYDTPCDDLLLYAPLPITTGSETRPYLLQCGVTRYSVPSDTAHLQLSAHPHALHLEDGATARSRAGTSPRRACR